MSGVISAISGSKLRVGLFLILLVGGAVAGAFAVGVLGVPSVAAVDNTFGEVTNETTAIETDLVVSNPNPVGIGLDGVSVNYTVSMNDIEMAQGGKDGVSVGTGNSTLELETGLRNGGIPAWWVSHVRNGERTTVDIDATVTSDLLGRSVDFSRSREIQTDLLSAFNSEETRPVNADSPLADDPILYVNETRGAWGTVSESETPIEMAFTVYNPNLEPYAVTEIGYEITMNGVAMGSGQTDQGYVIPSYSTETVDLSTNIENQHLDDWWVTHLDEDVRGHQVTGLRIEFYAVVEFPSGEQVTVPLDSLAYEETIETDIFDEGADTNNDGGSSESGSDSGDNETTDDSSGTSDDESSTDGDTTDGDTTTDDSGGETDGDTTTDDTTENGTDDSDDDGLIPL